MVTTDVYCIRSITFGILSAASAQCGKQYETDVFIPHTYPYSLTYASQLLQV
jgi:hypothetical protein